MATISSLETDIQSQLEETADDIGIFWNVANEIRPAIVEACNESTLITGEPQVRAATAPFTIPATTVFTPFALPAIAVNTTTNSAVGSIGIPLQVLVGSPLGISVNSALSVDSGANQEWVVVTAINQPLSAFTAVFTKTHLQGVAVTNLAAPGAFALLRVEGPGSLAYQKYSMWDLDRSLPGWELATGPVPLAWFPFGLGQFGIYPNLTAPATVILSYVQMPITTAPPWDGTQVIPFQPEYFDGLKDAAQHYLQFKEGDPEFTQSFGPYNRFLASCEEMSHFAWRKNSLRFTRSGGASSAITPVRGK